MVHHEIDGVKSGTAMGGGCGHNDDRRAGREVADAVKDGDAVERPASAGLGGGRLDCGLRKPGIVLERQHNDVVRIGANLSDKGGNCAGGGVCGSEFSNDFARIEVIGGDRDAD